MSKELKQYNYYGNLSDALNLYVAEKRGMGILLNGDAKKLAHFDRFTMKRDCTKNTLSKELVIAYTSKTANESSSNHLNRIHVVNRLALFMQRIGFEAYYQSTKAVKKTITNYSPYIFSEEEIDRMLTASKQYKHSTQHKTKHLVVPMMFMLLYTCGFRISEVLNLTVGDVDLETGIISVRNTKFDKSRNVPLSKATWEQCKTYSRAVHSFSSDEAIFLPNARGQVFGMTTSYDIFREILFKAGISHGGTGKGPRIHDLRHTFAVHCLKKWSETGVDLFVALPYLSTYLGHTGLNSTQKYLRLTSELYPTINKMLVAKFGEIIPSIRGGLANENI